MFKITLSSGKTFYAESDNSIFSAAYKNNIVFEHSCLNGRCSSCKAKVLKGKTENVSFEFGLNDEEKKAGYILTCASNPLSDLELQIQDLGTVKLFPVRTIPAKINCLERINDSVIYLKLRVPPNAAFQFIAGQYVNLIHKNIKRSYSIAGLGANGLEFYIKRYENGLFSDYLFNHAKVDDILRLEGPMGTFFLRENSKENLVFLATGTGIAPIIAILNDPKNKEILRSRRVSLFYGGRRESELQPFSFLKDFEIKYFPVLSREERPGFERGYVQDVLLNNSINLTNTSVYACGSSAMIHDAKERLMKAGLHEAEFYSDEFVVSNSLK